MSDPTLHTPPTAIEVAELLSAVKQKAHGVGLMVLRRLAYQAEAQAEEIAKLRAAFIYMHNNLPYDRHSIKVLYSAYYALHDLVFTTTKSKKDTLTVHHRDGTSVEVDPPLMDRTEGKAECQGCLTGSCVNPEHEGYQR